MQREHVIWGILERSWMSVDKLSNPPDCRAAPFTWRKLILHIKCTFRWLGICGSETQVLATTAITDTLSTWCQCQCKSTRKHICWFNFLRQKNIIKSFEVQTELQFHVTDYDMQLISSRPWQADVESVNLAKLYLTKDVTLPAKNSHPWGRKTMLPTWPLSEQTCTSLTDDVSFV